MNNDEILYVSNLAKINVSNEEYEHYKEKLKVLKKEMDEIMDINADEIEAFTTCDNVNKFNEMEDYMVDKDVLFKSIGNKDETYLETMKVLND